MTDPIHMPSSAAAALPAATNAPRRLPEAAQRALAEAEERRAAIDAEARAMPAEHGGRGGKEPVRYGDWEIKGLACDF